MQGPIQGPVTDPGIEQRDVRDLLPDQVSPHESAIGSSPFPPSHANSVQTPKPVSPADFFAGLAESAPVEPPARRQPEQEPVARQTERETPAPQAPRSRSALLWDYEEPARPQAPSAPSTRIDTPDPAQQPPFSQPRGFAGPAPRVQQPPMPQSPPRFAGPIAPVQPPPFSQPASFSRAVAPPAQPPAPFPVAPPWQQMSPPVAVQNRLAYRGAPPPQRPLVPPNGRQFRKKRRFPIWARVAVAILAVLVLATGASAWYYESTFGGIVSNSTGQTATKFNQQSASGAPQQNATPITSAPLSRPMNILLLGSDNDAKFNGTLLAQTDIIVRIDPATKKVVMLSIPRDMQVTIPGVAHPDKLDTAFSYGYLSKRTPDNPYADAAGLAIATIEQNYGIPIDHYAWVGLDGFIKVIDTAGGVDVDVLHPMVDDNYPDDINTTGNKVNLVKSQGYRRIYIAPGPQHLNGIQALEYVRTRHSDQQGDFGRSLRQQQVLNQLKTRLANSDIIAKLPELAQDLNGHVKTSMSLNDIISLANFARDLDPNNIERVVLGPPYAAAIPKSTNFAPVCSLIIPKLQQTFDLGDQARCLPQASNGTSPVAVASASSPTNSTSATSATSSMANTLQAFSQVNTASLNQSNDDPFGVHSLLDLMFMVVFESPEAMDV